MKRIKVPNFTKPVALARSFVLASASSVFQLGSLGFGCLAAYDLARPLGHLVVALSLGFIGYTIDGGKKQ